MVIDIDSFLDAMDKNPQEELQDDHNAGNKEKKVSLDFQKDVEDKIAFVESDADNKDLKILRKIYDEVKNFDQDLPNKFSGIETKGRDALRSLGEKYTSDFVSFNKNNAKILTQRINDDLKVLEQSIVSENFSDALNVFKRILENYEYFPKSFLKERLDFSVVLKQKENDLCALLETYKEKKKLELRSNLNLAVADLKKGLKLQDVKRVEFAVSKIQALLNSVPKVLNAYFASEKVKSNEVLIYAETFLYKKYEEEFLFKVEKLNLMFEKFHSSYINKRLDEVLLLYNEILVVFESMPDYFLEKKVELYKDINKLFGNVNNLVLEKNLFMFMETYELSRKIDAVNDYLVHVSRFKNINYDNLVSLREKVLLIPERYEVERQNIVKKIDELISSRNLKPKVNVVSEQDSSQVFSDVKMQVKGTSESLGSDEGLNEGVLGDSLDDVNGSVNQGSSLDSLREVNVLYEELKRTSNTAQIKILYKRIMFYLNMTNLKADKKADVIKRVNDLVRGKRLS